MIRVAEGRVELKGNVVDLCTDLTMAIKSLNETFLEAGMKEEEIEERFQDAVKFGMMKREDVMKRIAEELFSDDFVGVMEEFMDFLREKKEEK